MSLTKILCSLAAAIALCWTVPAAAKPAKGCPAGEGKVHGKCVKLCAINGPFQQPDACECPAGFGKILLGNGGGQCERLRCPTGSSIDAGDACDCAPGYQKAPAGQGKVRCAAPQPTK
jgi:hypothetical protein